MASPTRTALFRAVLPGELESIIRLQRVINPPGILVKYFALESKGARRYAGLAEQGFGMGPFSIVTSSIETRLLTWKIRATVDGGIGSVAIPTDLLYALAVPLLLERS